MKPKLRAAASVALCVVLIAGLLPGCAGGDNPKIADAPPLPPPKPEELQQKNANKRVKAYGSLPKYQKAMEKLNN